MYSWIAYASKQGYPTLAIDRLDYGNSSKPDPVNVVQVPIHVEVVHALVQIIRGFPNLYLSRAFPTIVYVGHSYGSIIGNGVNAKYPYDIDVTVLTDFSRTSVGFPGVLASIVPEPANTVNPTDYGTLPSGYLEATNQSGVKFAFFGPTGSYSPGLAIYDYSMRGTISIGDGGKSYLNY